MPVGTLIALGALGPVASNVGWRLSLLGGVGLSAVALAAFAVLYRRAPTPTEQRAHSLARPLRSVVPSLPVAIWLLGFIWMLFNVAAISFLTFGPDYFLARGYGVEVAGLLAAILMLLSPPLAPLVGHLLDRLGHAEWFVGIGGLLVAGSIFALSTTDYPPIVLLLLLSLGTAIVPTPVFALPPQILRPQQLGIAYGAISTFLNVGIVLGPYVTGLARDLTGGYRLSLDLMSVAALLVTILAGVLVLVRGRAGRASGRDRPAPGLS
jgi:MFS family permease